MFGNSRRTVRSAPVSPRRRKRRASASQRARGSRRGFEPLEPRLVLDGTSLVINEFMAINDDHSVDGDGNYSDWIEIYNPTSAAVDLEGWYLTDEKNDSTKWPFPSETLNPNGYLVVFATGKDDAEYPYYDRQGNLHTNFKLDGDGEYLALTHRGDDGVTVAQAFDPFPRQEEDISYGLSQGLFAFSLPTGEELTYQVPAGEEATWADLDFDDSPWASFAETSTLAVSEASTLVPDWVEIQNVSTDPIDVSGWSVAVNDASINDINAVHDVRWELSGIMQPGDVDYRHDDKYDTRDPEHYWNTDIVWRSFGKGWVMILDDGMNVVDFTVWCYDDAELAEMAVDIDGTIITAEGIWSGPAVPANTGNSNTLQRGGSSDRGNAGDFAFTAPQSQGQANLGLDTPFVTSLSTGIGFDAGASGLKSGVRVDIESEMRGVNSSLRTRFPFQLGDATVLDTLTLRMKYNDGFVAYVNGHEIASDHAPDPLSYDSAATDTRTVATSLEFVDFDISEILSEGVLQPGTNVLAIHGLNSQVDDENFLILPELVGTAMRYFDFPTRRAANTTEGFLNFVADTKFSVDRGFHDDPFALEITTQTPGAAIYFTLDGSEPSETNGICYANPIPITGTTILRAAAFKEGYQPTNVDTQTYVFLDDVLTQSPGGQAATVPGTPVLGGFFGTGTEGFIYVDDAFPGTANPDFADGQFNAGGGYAGGALRVNLGPGSSGGIGPTSGAWTRAFTVTEARTYSLSLRYRLRMGEGYEANEYSEVILEVDGARYGWDDNQSLIHEQGDGNGGSIQDYGWRTAGFSLPLSLGVHTITVGVYNNNATAADEWTEVFIDNLAIESPRYNPGWPTSNVNGQIIDYGMDPDIVNNGTWGPQLREALTSVPTMSLVTDLESLFSPGSGIYVNARQDGRSWERPGSLELIYPPNVDPVDPGPGFPDGIGDGFQVNTGIRIRGGYSRSGDNPKHAFRLFFREEYGDARLNYPLFGDEGVDRFDKIDLRTSQNYSWSYGGDGNNAMCRDVFARDTQGLMGQPYTRSRYYHLYVNGQYWGLFQTQERSEAAYGESYFGGDREDYDTVKVGDGYNIHATDGNLTAWQDVWNRTRAGFASDAAYYRIQGCNPDGTRNPNYPVLIDIDNLIDYMLVIFYDGDRDAPISNFLSNNSPNNWYGVRNRYGDEGFKFFCHDSEHTLTRGASSRVGPYPAGYDNFYKSNPQIVHQELMAHPEYRLRFADRTHKYLRNGGLLTDDAAAERFLARAAQIDMAIIAESARWGDSKRHPPRNKYDWQGAISRELSNFFHYSLGRAESLIGQLRNTRLMSGALAALYPGVEAPVFNRHGGEVPPGFALTMTVDSQAYQDTVIFTQGVEACYLVPQNNDLGTTWTETGFDDGAWDRGPTGIGYENSPTDYRNLIGTQVKPQDTYPQHPECNSVFIRIPFTIDDLASVDRLTLRMKYDDGFVAYLNGREMISPNVSGTAAYDSTASNHDDGAAAVFEDIDISSYINRLNEGSNNVLAIHGINTHTGSTDMLFLPELVVGTLAPNPTMPVYYTLDGSDPREPGSPTFSGPPIILNEPTLVKARTYNQGTGQWSALNEATYFVGEAAAAENLVVTEINYHPADPTAEELAAQPAADEPFTSNDFEFVELKNVGGNPIDLTGAQFSKGLKFTFPVTWLPSGETVVVVNDPEAFAARYDTAGLLIAGQYEGDFQDVLHDNPDDPDVLDDSGETITLLARSGDPILNFTYGDSSAPKWPDRADGRGASLELIDPAAVPATEPARTDYLQWGDHWRSSSEYGGSPGTTGAGRRGDVLVNEVLTHTVPLQLDAIELFNTTSQAIPIDGWYLSDSSNNYRKFRVPDGTSIPAQGYVVFDERDFNPNGLWNPDAGPRGPNEFALDGAHGDDVWLMEADADGTLTRFVDHVEFGAAPRDESFGRWPNGQGDLYPMTVPTLDRDRPENGQNSGPRVGPLIISEVHYNSGESGGADDLEFVEIYNPTDQAVPLTNWRIRKGIDYDFDDTTQVAPYGTVVVLSFNPDNASNQARVTTFRNTFSIDESVLLVGGYGGKLENAGEKVQLQRPGNPPAEDPDFFPRLLEDEVDYDNEFPWPTTAAGGGHSLQRLEGDLWGNDPASWTAADPTPGRVDFAPETATVEGRYAFYNNSAFDEASRGLTDSDAIAPDAAGASEPWLGKTALLPGHTATFQNYTSYDKGLNGIIIDVADLRGTPTADSFTFKIGNDDNPGGWPDARDPIDVTVSRNAGVGNSDRVTIIWEDHAIKAAWLQVTVKAEETGLGADDVFYFGNAPGECGDSTGNAIVNTTDEILARSHLRGPRNPAAIDDPYDYNRDRLVNTNDRLIARWNRTGAANCLRLISVPGTGGGLESLEATPPDGAVFLPASGRPDAGDLASARDAVFTRAARRESGRPKTSPEKLAWLLDYEQLRAQKRSSGKDRPVATAVDTLMVRFGQ